MIHEQRTEEEHRAWLDSLSPEEHALVMIPTGYRITFLLIAVFKRILQGENLKDAERLWYLEKLNDMAGEYISADMLKQVDPASDLEMKIFCEGANLDRGSKRGDASYKLLTEFDTFKIFVQANAGLHKAIKVREKAA